MREMGRAALLKMGSTQVTMMKPIIKGTSNAHIDIMMTFLLSWTGCKVKQIMSKLFQNLMSQQVVTQFNSVKMMIRNLGP